MVLADYQHPKQPNSRRILLDSTTPLPPEGSPETEWGDEVAEFPQENALSAEEIAALPPVDLGDDIDFDAWANDGFHTIEDIKEYGRNFMLLSPEYTGVILPPSLLDKNYIINVAGDTPPGNLGNVAIDGAYPIQLELLPNFLALLPDFFIDDPKGTEIVINVIKQTYGEDGYDICHEWHGSHPDTFEDIWDEAEHDKMSYRETIGSLLYHAKVNDLAGFHQFLADRYELGGFGPVDAPYVEDDIDGFYRALDHVGWGIHADVRSNFHYFVNLTSRETTWRSHYFPANAWNTNWIKSKIHAECVTGKGDKSIRYSKDAWNTHVNAVCYETQTDYFLDWIEGLPPHDGVPRLAESLMECFSFDLQEADLVRWISTFLMLGAIQRAYHPGDKMDETPVLFGPQGCGKSTYLAWQFPEEWRSKWFTDRLTLTDPTQTKVEAIQGIVLAEIGEMAGSTRAEMNDLKMFLSSTNDRVRLSYRQDPEELPRRSIFCGTANSTSALPNDPSGLRRFVAVSVLDGDPDKVRVWLDTNRKKLWAEALAMYHSGVHPRLPNHLKSQQSASNEGHRYADSEMEDEVMDWLVGNANVRHFTLLDVAKDIGIAEDLKSLHPRDRHRISKALTLAGSATSRVGSRDSRKRQWSNPHWSEEEPEVF